MRATLLMLLVLVPGVPAASAAVAVVSSEPTAAAVSVDGVAQGTTPCRLSLEEGRRRIVVELDGYETLDRAVDVGQDMLTLNLVMSPKRYSVNMYFHDVTITDWHAYTVAPPAYLGGVPGTLSLQRGKQSIVLARQGFRDIRLTVDVLDDGQTVELEPPQPGPSSYARLLPLHFVGYWENPNDANMRTWFFDNGTFLQTFWTGGKRFGRWQIVPTTAGIVLRASATGDRVETVDYVLKDGTLDGRAPKIHRVLRRASSDVVPQPPTGWPKGRR